MEGYFQKTICLHLVLALQLQLKKWSLHKIYQRGLHVCASLNFGHSEEADCTLILLLVLDYFPPMVLDCLVRQHLGWTGCLLLHQLVVRTITAEHKCTVFLSRQPVQILFFFPQTFKKIVLYISPLLDQCVA